MTQGDRSGDRDSGEELAERVARTESRMLRARRRRGRTMLFGMGMFGLIGWSLAVPVLLGLAVGIWLDKNFDSGISWTVTILMLGFVLGALNAWFWIEKESKGDR